MKQFWNKLLSFFHWSKSSYIILSSFLLIIFLIGYIWWPLLQEYAASYRGDLPFWVQVDWLLTILIMINADLKRDIPLAAIALVGGLLIEAWGTQTELWTYYTNEHPPLWIIPAWPIAFLAVNRLVQLIEHLLPTITRRLVEISYWVIFSGFYILMIFYIWPTITKPLSIAVIILCAILILTNFNKKDASFYFLAGSGLGYFLELWGTSRACWTYYTQEAPPLFAVFAHGFAAFAVWQFYQFTIRIFNLIHKRISLKS
ncbi:MAG: hypothetical protein ABIG43_04175 [Chloroflexota bacterium]